MTIETICQSASRGNPEKLLLHFATSKKIHQRKYCHNQLSYTVSMNSVLQSFYSVSQYLDEYSANLVQKCREYHTLQEKPFERLDIT